MAGMLVDQFPRLKDYRELKGKYDSPFMEPAIRPYANTLEIMARAGYEPIAMVKRYERVLRHTTVAASAALRVRIRGNLQTRPTRHTTTTFPDDLKLAYEELFLMQDALGIITTRHQTAGSRSEDSWWRIPWWAQQSETTKAGKYCCACTDEVE